MTATLSIFAAGFLAGGFFVAAMASRRARKDFAVLAYLMDEGESYGLPMIKAGLGHRGTIYLRLRNLEDRGLIVSREDDSPEALSVRGGLPRRLYRLTDVGLAALQVEVARHG